MKLRINWKLRFKNKTTFVSLICVVVSFIYNILGLLGVVPSVSEELVVQIIMLLSNFLVGIGVLIDPSTAGLDDSERVMTYNSPRQW